VWVSGSALVVVTASRLCGDSAADTLKEHIMGYGIGGILITILVILAIIYFAKRV